MTTTHNTLTPQVRDLNKVMDWLDVAEEAIVENNPTHPAASIFEKFKGGDVQQRLANMVTFMELDDWASEEFPNNVHNSSFCTVLIDCTLRAEVLLRAIASKIELEVSYEIFSSREIGLYAASALLNLTGIQLDVDKLNEYLNTPVTVFAE